MNKKEKFFRNIVSNSIIGVVVLATLIFSINLTAINTSGEGNSPISKGSSKTHVSLMVNVYWGTEFIEPMLEIFRTYGVKTTFFVGGTWVAENEKTLQKIYADGHEIGNHGYFHNDHKNLDEKRNFEEMNVTHKLVKSILDYEMKLFSPPFASYSKTTLNVAEKMGYKTILYTHDTMDWRDNDVNLIVSRATKKIAAGDLVLLHPTKQTVDALVNIIREIYAKNLQVGTVSKVLGAEV